MHSTANPWALSKGYSVNWNYLLRKRNLSFLAYIIAYYVYSFFSRIVNFFLINCKIHSWSTSRAMTLTLFYHISEWFWGMLLLSRFSCVRLCATPWTAAHQAPPSLGFSRQEHWSGLPFPSPMHESEKWKWSCSVVSNPQQPHGLQPSRLLCPWDFPGKSTGVGCHCLLRDLACMPLNETGANPLSPGGGLKGAKPWSFTVCSGSSQTPSVFITIKRWRANENRCPGSLFQS